MAEKKTQDTPPAEQPSDSMEKPKDPVKTTPDKTTTVPLPPVDRVTSPAFTKTPPNDLYRRLLPAVLFLLTFVTVMTMLLIYMDTVALGAHQFRVNMTRDYELARIPQESPTLVAYVRQLHLAPRPARQPPAAPTVDERGRVVDQVLGEIYNGSFVEYLPSGPRVLAPLYLETVRGWRGVVVRAEPRSFLQLRATSALHACLSATKHPREVMYRSAETSPAFSSRVLCLPLYTILLAALSPTQSMGPATGQSTGQVMGPATEQSTGQVMGPATGQVMGPARGQVSGQSTGHDYVVLGGEHVYGALESLPPGGVKVKMFEIYCTDAAARNKTTALLAGRNYVVAATFPDSVMYALKDDKNT